ncbi:MAG: hypothetical protein U0359_04935 [Byssovorax sp.]
MTRGKRAPLLLCVPAAIGALVTLFSLADCGTTAPQDPSYLLVELQNVKGAAATPSSAMVEVIEGKETLTTLCVKLADPGAQTPASFVLERDFGKDAKARVTVQVTAFDGLSGDGSAAVGKEFACPSGALPPPLTDPQIVEADFCEGKARKIVFHVGASCACPGDPMTDGGPAEAGVDDAGSDDAGSDAGPGCGCNSDAVCGAGLSTTGNACAPGECCARSISGACALESPP